MVRLDDERGENRERKADERCRDGSDEEEVGVGGIGRELEIKG